MKLSELRKRSDAFISNINVKIEFAIMNVEQDLVNMNKNNLLNSKDSDNNPLVHKSTGSEFLTTLYAIRTRKQKPNLFLTGAFQKNMFLSVNENNLTYFIDSLDEKSGILTENYGNKIFGIPDDRTTEAKKITGNSFKKIYNKEVLDK